MSAGDLMDRALHRSRPGDILFIASELDAAQSEALLIKGGRYLRNLMAYPAAVEVLDQLLAVNPAHVAALEQKALCLARRGGDYAALAQSVLDDVLALVKAEASGGGESLSILARLNKERWTRAWFSAVPPEGDDEVQDNCREASSDSFYLWASIDHYLESFEQNAGYYTAINAATLLALAAHLNQRIPNSQPRTAAIIQSQLTDIMQRTAPLIEAASTAAGNDEDAYWALATELEWQLISGDERDPEKESRIPLQATQLIRKAGIRRFLLDSTVSQFRLFRALGFRPNLVTPALDALEAALNFTPNPALPEHRIVCLQAASITAEGHVELSRPGSSAPASPELVAEKMKALYEAHPDVMALIAVTDQGALAAAEACKAMGLPYELFMTEASEKCIARLSAGSPSDSDAAWLSVLRKARECNVLPTCVGVRADADADARLAAWVLDSARAYGESRVTVLLDEAGNLQERAGASLHAGGESSAPEPAGPAKAAGPQTPKPAPAPAEEIRPVPEPPAVIGSLPTSIDAEIERFYEYCSREETRARWNAYSDSARGFLMSIGLNWEPFGLGAPVLLERNTLGFELLTEGPGGMRFGEVMGECERQGIAMLDFELVVLLKGLNAIQALRSRLRMALGVQADSLLMSVNVGDLLVSSPEFVEVVARYRLDETTLFEINENLSMERVNVVRQLADTYKIRLALDDSNDMQEDVRKALLDKVDLIKVDFKFTRNQLSHIGQEAPGSIMEELVHLRQPDMPLVIEGIESEQDIIFIQNHWKRAYGDLFWQGWAVQVSGLLERFFEPCNNRELPKGYRLAPGVLLR